ncbi:MAG: AAA family ATPase [Planctomycetota bacterium]
MIKRMRIKNFKSLSDVTVNLDDLTVLIGRTGSGKTNFVDALRFIRQYLTTRNTSFVTNMGGWKRVVSATTKQPKSLSFEIVFSVQGVEGDFVYKVNLKEFPNNSDEFRLSSESLSLGDATLFQSEAGAWVKVPKIVPLIIPEGELMLATLSGIQEVAIAHVYLTDCLGCYDFPSDILQKSAQGSGKGLDDTGINYLETFAVIEGNLQALYNWREIVEALKVLIPSVKSVETSKPNRKRVAVAHEIGDRSLVMDLSQESEGFRRFLAHLIALYQSPPKQTLVFEEPEKGIHPGALAALAEQLKACPKARRGQVIITTHSPELLDKFPVDNIRIVERSNYETQIGSVTVEQMQSIKESLMSTGEMLTVDPARLSLVSTGTEV